MQRIYDDMCEGWRAEYIDKIMDWTRTVRLEDTNDSIELHA